jgi:hypothetical protein
MNGNKISTCCHKIVDERRRIPDHKMNMKRSSREWTKGSNEIREEKESWYEVSIRYINVVKIRKGLGPPNFIP